MLWAISVFIGVTIVGAVLIFLNNGRLTRYLEGPSFREELNKQTSKGLHFTGEYGPIKRTGFLSASCPDFHGEDGEKAFQSITVKGITGTFNPLGVFLRRWQLDSIHIESGVAKIQVYEPKPQQKKPKPWYAIFMPDRVYLKEVICEKADITWKVQKKDSGFLGTRAVITPYGRDFEYRLTGGKFKMPSIPVLAMTRAHARITKEKLSLYELVLETEGDGSIQIEGEAGLKENKRTQAQVDISRVPISPWIPAEWGDQVRGRASGHLRMTSPDQNLQSSSGQGELSLSGAKFISIPFLDYAASATKNEALKHLDLDDCVVTFDWKYPAIHIREIRIVAKGEFRLEGTIELNKSQLAGSLKLGVTEKNLEWLPKAKEEIFTREEGGYLWTTVKLSGTLQEPQNDLTPRLANALKRSPLESTGLFFRQVGEWFQQTFSKD